MLKKISLLLILAFSTYATVYLDIEIIHEKVLGDKVILKSELMSSELVYNKKEISLQMKNGIQLRIIPIYNEIENEFDKKMPLKIQGIIQNVSSAKKVPKTFDLSLMLDKSGDLNFSSGDGQITKVKITPKIK